MMPTNRKNLEALFPFGRRKQRRAVEERRPSIPQADEEPRIRIFNRDGLIARAIRKVRDFRWK